MKLKVEFTEEEYTFIKSEFGYSKKDVDKFTEDDLWDLQDKCADIEINAAMDAGDNELSDRGNIAADIVTKIGNMV